MLRDSQKMTVHSHRLNYFAEWVAWNGLVIAAEPSWLALYGADSFVILALLGAVLLLASWSMYRTLVLHTRAVPSE